VAEQGLGVPERFRSALKTLAEIDEDSFREIVARLSEDPRSLATSALAPRIADALPEHSSRRATQIVEAILSLMAQERGLGLARDDIAAAVSRAENLEVLDELRPRFAKRLIALLGVPTLRTALKAHDLMTEHAHVFARARLFTDIRPVFGDSGEEPPVAAVIIDTLKVEYFNERNEPDAFFVALDRLDHEQLKGSRRSL
jgi:hypothetical protein